jgi:outer membrane protein OmpA-like peptidoglycan-associated protein
MTRLLMLARFTIFTSILIFTNTATATAQNADIDKNTIIRSLAPIRYLAQHSGQARAIDLDIEFKTGSSNLTHRAKRQLDIVSDALKDQKLAAERFQIVGHTDASGRANMNLKLSQRRAKAVFDYLVQKGGIRHKRLMPSGQGETRLKNVLAPTSGVNRRVEFVLIQSKRTKADNQQKSGPNEFKEKVIKW